jgi:hypothetical protein
MLAGHYCLTIVKHMLKMGFVTLFLEPCGAGVLVIGIKTVKAAQ